MFAAATEPGLDPKKRAGRYELDHFTTYKSRHISLANAAGSRRARKTQSLYNSFAATEIWDPGPGRRTGWAVAWQNRILFPCDFMLTCRICRILLRNAVPTNLIRFAGVVWEGLGDGSLRMEQGFLRSGWPPAPARRVGLGLIGLGWDGVGLGWGGGCFTDSSWL